MSNLEQRELARIRQELRERFADERHEGTRSILARLRALAEHQGGADLRAEYERWRFRFDMLQAFTLAA